MKLPICIGCLFLAIAGMAQKTEVIQEKWHTHTADIQKRAMKIKYGESRTKKEHTQNVTEIGKQLDSAIVEHEELKKSIPRKDREKVKNQTLAIDKHQLEARKQTEALKSELAKDKHDEMIIRHHAARLQVSMEKANKEQEILKEKTSK